MRTVLGWTILGATTICVAAAAPRERLSAVVLHEELVAFVSNDRREEIGAAVERITTAGTPESVGNDTWEDVRGFYAASDGPAWATYTSTSKASDALELLRAAGEHGLNPADYSEAELSAALESLDQSHEDQTQQIERLAAFDVQLTSALLDLGRDVAIGRTGPEAADPRWKARRELPDLVATLRNASADLNGWLKTVQPPHPEYAALQRALQDLSDQRDHGGWPAVPALPKKLKLGESDPAVTALRQRLAATGELSESAAAQASPLFDEDLEKALRAFQETHGLSPTGVPDAATVASLNVPIDHRIRQLALNLERWRWMPDDLGPDHVFVNIPAFMLFAREDGQTAFDMRIVVGKRTLRTPVFSSEMTTVVFSPYWHIPGSIVTGETVPAAAKDPEYLQRRGIEILRASKTGATPVDPAEVDWSDPSQVRQLAFRQRPGAQNALGNVKFLFPNSFDVYLHDTPSDSLFARASRALSHGCVRLAEPERLAQFVLRDRAEWDDARIVSAMGAGSEKGVKLDTRLPVHIAYFTAWVNDDGRVSFYDDVYGYDKSQIPQ